MIADDRSFGELKSQEAFWLFLCEGSLLVGKKNAARGREVLGGVNKGTGILLGMETDVPRQLLVTMSNYCANNM